MTRLEVELTTARLVAALRVAENHHDEFEKAILVECRKRHIPRLLPQPNERTSR